MSKPVRKIIVKGKTYFWSLPGNEVYSSGRRITVTLEGTSWSRLYIDPYPHDFEIRPQIIERAIEAASERGWKPEKNSGDMYLTFRDGKIITGQEE